MKHIAVVLTLTLLACTARHPKSKKSKHFVTTSKPFYVKTTTPKFMQLDLTTNYMGTFLPSSTITITTPFEGNIQYIGIQENERIPANYHCFTLNRSKPGLKYLPYIIKCPSSGLVLNVNVVQGQYVTAFTPLATIVKTSPMYFQLKLPIKIAYKISSKNTFKVKLINSNKIAHVRFKSLLPIALKFVTDVIMECLDCEDVNVIPMQKGTIKINIGKLSGYWVPLSSVVYLENKPYVYLLEGKKAKRLPVKVEYLYNNMVLIKAKNLSSKMRVISEGAFAAEEAKNIVDVSAKK